MSENKKPTLVEQVRALCASNRDTGGAYYWILRQDDLEPEVARFTTNFVSTTDFSLWTPAKFALTFPATKILSYITPPIPEHRVTVVRCYPDGVVMTDTISVESLTVEHNPELEVGWTVDSLEETSRFIAVRDTKEKADAVAEKIRSTPNGKTVNIEYSLPATVPTPKAKPACGSCRFYMENIAGSTDGKCHRYPPKTSGWPFVGFGDFCGEFQPATEPTK